MIGDGWAAVMALRRAPWNERDFGCSADWPRALWDAFMSSDDVWRYHRARELLVRLHQRSFLNRPNPPLPRSQYRYLACKAFADHGLTPEDVMCYLSNRNYSHIDKPQEDKSSTIFRNLPVAEDEGDNEDATLQKEEDVTLKKGAREYKPCMDAFRSKSKGKRPKILEYNCKSMNKKARRSYEDLKPYKTKPDEDNKDECPSNDQDMRVAEDDSDNENDTSDMVSCFHILTRGIEDEVSCYSHANPGNNVKLKTHVRQNKK